MQNKFFPAICFAESVNVLTGWLILTNSSALSVSIVQRSTKRRRLPFGFLCALSGLTYLLKRNYEMMPYLCRMASSTRMSSLKLFGAGRLWLLSKGVRCTLNSVLISLSKRAKMSGSATIRTSTACLASSSRVESVQSKLDRNGFLELVF